MPNPLITEVEISGVGMPSSNGTATDSTSTFARPHSSSTASISSSKAESTRHSSEAARTHSSRTSSQNFTIPEKYLGSSTFDSDAPAPYKEEDIEKESAEEQKRMRKRDYAIEISRIMGRQLVKGLNGKPHSADER